MVAAAIEYTQGRIEVNNNHFANIQTYGENNDYPQSVIDIVAASVTGSSCLQKFIDFVYGRGFADKDVYQKVVNDDGETADSLLRKVVEDYCRFYGFAIHVNRNMLGQITSMSHIPFETVRRCTTDNKYNGKVAIHPDWRHTDGRYKNVEIEYIDLFTPDRNEFLNKALAAEGGFLGYQGQVYYFSMRGSNNYPIPIYDSALTDMATQEAISNITYRNSRKNFIPGCIIAEIKAGFDPKNEEDQEAFEQTNEQIKKMMGDANASSVLHIVVDNEDELPKAIPINVQNYDKAYTVSSESVEKKIGQSFMQPSELRCEDSSKGFSQDTMEQAYKVYNATTEDDRLCLEREFAYLFKFWVEPMEINTQIEPRTYGTETLLSTLGEKVKDVVEIATNTAIDIYQRKAILIRVYCLSEDIANDLLLIKNSNNNANND